MTAPIYNPATPYLGPVFGGMATGKLICIQGTSHPGAQRFSINLQCGPNVNPRDDIALHIDVRFVNSTIVRNSLVMQQWGPEELFGPFPLGQGQSFEIMILAEHTAFKIAINGLHYAEYRHRMPMERVSYLAIDGDITISCIRMEGGTMSYMPTPGTAPPPYGHSPYQVAGAAPVPYVAPPTAGVAGAYPKQPGVSYTGATYAPPIVAPTYSTFPHSPHRSPYHSPHVSRSAAIPIVGGAATGLLAGAMLYGGHKHMKKQKKWMKKGFKHKMKLFKHKHKHGFHFHHGFHRHSSSSSSEEE